MSSELSSMPDELLDGVDWDSVTLKQSSDLGLTLSLFNDAVVTHDLASVAFSSRAWATVVALIAGLVTVLWTGAAGLTVLIAIVASLAVGAIQAWWQVKRVKRIVLQAAAALREDVARLPRAT